MTPTRPIMIRAGFLAYRSIADFFGVQYNQSPQPTDPISVTRDEFIAAYEAARRRRRAGTFRP